MHGHRGRAKDPLFRCRRTLLTDKQSDRLEALFATDDHVEVEITGGIYQRMNAAYRDKERAQGRQQMSQLIEALSRGVPAALTEVITLGP